MGMNPACRGCKYEYPLFNNTCALCGDHNLYEPREPEEKEKENKPMKKTKAMLEEELEQKRTEIEDLKKELENEIKRTEKYKQFEECADDLKALQHSFINSGFSEKQAFMMVLQIIGSARPKN